MYLQQFFVDGLGCASYLVGSEAQGVAAVIDPDRDVQQYLDAAEARSLRITHIIETHLHADHVSGSTDLARRTGAQIYLHENSQADFPHRPLKGGDEIHLGDLRLDVLHTPGHTPESITLLVADTARSPEPLLALTGDTLFAGDIGRPDLVGAEAAIGLAGQMHESIFHTLLPLNDSLLVYPGHGAGSLCGRSISSKRSSTLGYEREHNPALQPRQKDEFVRFAVSDLPEQPGNHTRIKAINRRGPAPLGEVLPKPISIRDAIPHFQRGAAMLDTRPKAPYVEKHVPGAVHLEADDQLSNRVSFILPPDLPLILIVEDEQAYRAAVFSLARVGYERVVGYLEGGVDAWEAAGYPVTSGDIEDITPEQLHQLMLSSNGDTPVVLDVREPWEYLQGHVPGAILIPLGELSRRTEDLDPETPVAVICAVGSRSQSGAAVLGQKNFRKIYNVLGGTMGWSQSGLPLER